jgi:hypothetical protein
MIGEIQQRVCIKFCLKLNKSATETLEILHEDFGEHSLNGIHKLKMTNVQVDQTPAKRQKMLKKFINSLTKTIAEQSMSSQTPLGSVMEFARRT